MSDLKQHRVVAHIGGRGLRKKKRQNTTWLVSWRAITVCIVCEPSRPTLVFVSLRWAWRGADTHSLWTEPSCGLKMKDRDQHLLPRRWMTEFILKCWNRQWKNRHADIEINLRWAYCLPFLLALSLIFAFVFDSFGPQCLTKGACAQARDKDLG